MEQLWLDALLDATNESHSYRGQKKMILFCFRLKNKNGQKHHFRPKLKRKHYVLSAENGK